MDFKYGVSVLRLFQSSVEVLVADAQGLGRHGAGLMTRGRRDNRDVSGRRSVWAECGGDSVESRHKGRVVA